MELEERLSYIEQLELEGDETFYSASGLPGKFGMVQPVGAADASLDPDSKPDAFVIGSHIAEFSKQVSTEDRQMIQNSFLLAQLAANKAIGSGAGGTIDWYEKYAEVLQNIGWVLESNITTHKVAGVSTQQVHAEILPLLALPVVGPAAPAAALAIKAVLEGLNNMEPDRRWITIFDRETQRASANQFQLSYAEVHDGSIGIWLSCFELDAAQSVTQVLFFDFSKVKAELRFATSTMKAAQAFDEMRDSIQGKVGAYIAANIAAIDI